MPKRLISTRGNCCNIHKHQRRSHVEVAVVFVLMLLIDACVGESPFAVGFRSALSHSVLRKRGPSTKYASPKPVVLVSSIDKEDEEDDEISTAFFRPTSVEEVARIRTARSAYLTKNVPVNREISEEEYIQSLIVPCAVSKTMSQNVEPPNYVSAVNATATSTANRGGASALVVARQLEFWENMICGAISRSVAQTVMHPANTMKTILQNARGPARPSSRDLLHPRNFQRLSQGAGANFLLSVPHGAVNFAVLEFVRKKLASFVDSVPALSERADAIGPGLDFLSSAISTITCSIVSTPQMMITDNIMAGNYPNLPAAVRGLAQQRGLMGFYAGWWPGLVGKIPSYALTWTFFQQLKLARDRLTGRPATDIENSVMGCIASGTTVCIMIPMDTIKTRLVTQASLAANQQHYKGIVDCAVRVFREEGIATFYRGLPPRLVSVVPMIGIQFGVYEFMKRMMLQREIAQDRRRKLELVKETYGREQVLEEAAMEVAASPEHPYPAPRFTIRERLNGKSSSITKKVQRKVEQLKKAASTR